METWAYMQDIPYPVSPGSYRYKTRAVSPATKKRYRLVYIKSGVKTPLLSDLETKSKLRYGLDVIDRGSQPIAQTTNTPITEMYSQSAAFAPPPTAETTRARARKNYVYIQKSRTTVDFNKLHPYHWNSTETQKTLPSVAPDAMYRNTFIKSFQEKTHASLQPQLKLKRGLALYEESVDVNENRPQTMQESKNVRFGAKNVFRPVTRQTKSAPFQQQRSANAISDTVLLRLEIKSANQRKPTTDDETGTLHTTIKNSIDFVKKFEVGDLLETPRLARPLNEKGRYRPHSQTRIPEQPPRKTKLRTNETEDTVEKEYKSVGPYLDLLKNTKTSQVMLPYNNLGMITPGMNEIINKYMTPGGFEETPRSNINDENQERGLNNPPASRCSTSHSQRINLKSENPEEEQNQAKHHVELFKIKKDNVGKLPSLQVKVNRDDTSLE